MTHAIFQVRLFVEVSIYVMTYAYWQTDRQGSRSTHWCGAHSG